MLKLYVTLFLVAIFGGIGYGAYAYYTSTQSTIAILRENNVKLTLANERLQETINVMRADVKRNAELNRKLAQQLQQAENNLDGLRKRFAEIDIEKEAQVDPDGLAVRINDAVDRLREELKNETTPPSADSNQSTNTE